MKKRIVSVLLLLALIVSTMGCGKQENDSWEETIQEKTRALQAETAALNSCTLLCNICQRAVSDHNEKFPRKVTVTLEDVQVLKATVDPDGYTVVEIMWTMADPNSNVPSKNVFRTVYNTGDYNAPLYYAIKRHEWLLDDAVHFDDYDTVRKLAPWSKYQYEVELETKSYTFK